MYYIDMNKIVTFKVSKGEDGFYVAAADDFGIHTQGKTFEDLLGNIREATELTFEENSNGSKSELPPIMMNIDYSEIHA